MAKIKARGLIDGKNVSVECVERNNRIEVYKNGVKDFSLELEIDVLIAEKNERRINLMPNGEIDPFALESYLLILREDIFDEPPEIETDGVNDSDISFFTAEHAKHIIF